MRPSRQPIRGMRSVCGLSHAVREPYRRRPVGARPRRALCRPRTTTGTTVTRPAPRPATRSSSVHPATPTGPTPRRSRPVRSCTALGHRPATPGPCRACARTSCSSHVDTTLISFWDRPDRSTRLIRLVLPLAGASASRIWPGRLNDCVARTPMPGTARRTNSVSIRTARRQDGGKRQRRRNVTLTQEMILDSGRVHVSFSGSCRVPPPKADVVRS